MSRRNQKFHLKPNKLPQRPITPEQLGLKAFHVGNYTQAIRHWESLQPGGSPAVAAAMAEAHFRRAMSARQPDALPFADLQSAIDLSPGEARYWYHLGLTLHRADRLDEARAAYARSADLGLARRGVDFVRGLAELETDPTLSLESLPWLLPQSRSSLEPVAALLRGEPQAASDLARGAGTPEDRAPDQQEPVMNLWRGLALVAMGIPSEAYTVLLPSKGQRLPVGAEATRAYYCGLAAFMSGNTEAAVAAWSETIPAVAAAATGHSSSSGPDAYHLHARSILAFQRDGKWEEAYSKAQSGLTQSPDDPWLLRAALIGANRLAETARASGEWSQARVYWKAMYDILHDQPELGKLPPVLHNLALVHETLEEWKLAAQAWTAVMDSMPRLSSRATKRSESPDAAVQEERRTWLRRRVMDNYMRAELPDEAIAYFKQAVKATPDDLDLRLEFATALLANDQTIAARNEVRRILEKDPKNVKALVLETEIHKEREDDVASEQSLRRILEIDPKHDVALHGMSRLLLARGVDAFNSGRYREAHKVYTEAVKYSPDDPQLLVYLGETEIALGNVKAGHAHFDKVLDLGSPEGYLHVFNRWVRHNNETEAKKILVRAEAAGVATPEFYLNAGVSLLKDAEPSSPFGPFGRLNRSKKATASEKWGRDLIAKGLNASPDRAEGLKYVVAALGPGHASVSIEYGREIVALDPEDPDNHVSVAVLEGLSGDVAGARTTLKHAERLARKQGRKDVMERIVELREQINSPMFGILGSLIELGGPDFLDEFE